MSVLVSELQTRLAYRLGEDSSPNDSNESARRLSFFNESYRKILGETYWWFLQTTASDTTISEQEIYTLPTGFRDMIELRVDEKVVNPISQTEALTTYNYPPISYYFDSMRARYYVFGDTELHIIPVVSEAPAAISVSSITQTSGVATVTTSSAHGYSNHQFITVAGANQSDYNGEQRITSVPTPTTLTFSVSSGATSPATGTITITKRNIVYRYWQYPTTLTASSTVLIPDQYADCLVAYAFARKVGTVEGMRGTAGDAIEEYNQITSDMRKENNRRKFFNKGIIPFQANSILE
jgi:hypothetical protein